MMKKVRGSAEAVPYPLFPSTRCSVYFMLFLTTLLQYAARFALNMSIVCMVVPAQHQHTNHSARTEATLQADNATVPSTCEKRLSTKQDFGYEGEFYWTRPQVGYILAAFFYAYIPMQIIAGVLADRFGIRHLLGSGMLIGGIVSLLTPVAARVHYGLLIALRAVMGLALGVMFPCVHSLIGKWVPDSERSTFLGFVFAGPNTGTILSFLLSGYLCQYSWTITFYVLGSVTIVWYIFFLYVVYSSPDDHPRISSAEKAYIASSYGGSKTNKPAKIPWRRILTSKSVLGVCVTHFCTGWVFYTLASGVPLYLQDVMYFNIKANSVLSSLPKIIAVVGSIVAGVLIDVIHKKLITSRHILRKSFESMYSVLTIISSITICFMKCNKQAEAIVLLCVMYLAVCFKRGGQHCSPSDLAPKMSGVVYGVTNFVANFSGFLAPIAIGNLTQNGTQAEWQRLFSLAAGVVCIGWLSFLFLVESYEQPWAREEGENTGYEIKGDENDFEVKVNLTSECKSNG